MLTRRQFTVTSAAALGTAGAGFAAELGDDGLHKEPWFSDTFLELGDDLAAAADKGRHLMILYEQNGCPYCRELHEVNFARSELTDYIKAHYDVIQLDMFGAREVLDFDGEALEERDLAAKWGVNFTPTTILMHSLNSGAQSIEEAQTFRMPGYLKPFHYLSSLEYVAEEKFEGQTFQRYLQDKFAELEEKGIDPDVW
ncbi:thioredoxin family protein [Lentibacter sp. XHP0401]|uniref:thioredoxin family protein n=1 Tax=Lentibacter sp. XHP0401 TaxID=2984334 RepID=UPI0021E7DB23|nr:thioredoxin family protein [Lentibacter sp. XHP0401]MCV2893911.1 thioredoxin family protein [Lentibacter sp. XHP0401]